MRLQLASLIMVVMPLGALSMMGCLNSSSGAGTQNPPASQPASGRASDRDRDFPLDSLQTAVISVEGKPIDVWLALTSDQQMEGLMHVPPEELPENRGMLFVFDREELRFFWMRNTITPLDIAYARANGEIVRTWQMPPLTLQNFPSVEPAMFALEMKAGEFARLGIVAGQRIVIPQEVFKAKK